MTIEPAELQPGTQFAGKYRIERLIGKGGFGAVYEVSNELGWRQALKILHPEIGANEVYRKRFLREMHIARDLMHENAVAVRDAGEYDGSLYYTMDFVDGKTISSEIKRLGKIEPSRAVEWALQVISFLEFLNQKGYLHRDLKPANIMIETDDAGRERVRVLDLGIARTLAADDDSGQTMLTGGMIIGTPVYMAPEHIAGDEVDQRIDYYALGVILYECVAGVKPFTGATVQRLYHAIHTETPPPLPKVITGFPRDLWRVIERAMAKNRDGRFPDGASFRIALAACRNENPTRDWEPTIMDTMIAPARRRMWKKAAIGGGIGLVLLFLVFVVPGWFGDGSTDGDDPNGSPGTAATNKDSTKNASDGDSAPTGPVVRVLPLENDRLMFPDRLVRVRVEAEGAPRFSIARDEIAAVPLTPEFVDGYYQLALPVPPGAVDRRIPYELTVADDRGEKTVEFDVLVDSIPPKIEVVRGPSGSTVVQFDSTPVRVSVHANEELSNATIDGEAATIDFGDRSQASALVPLTGAQGQSLDIVLVDRSGNRLVDNGGYTLVVEGVDAEPVASFRVTAPQDGAVVTETTLTFRGTTVGSGVLHIDDQSFAVGNGPFEEIVPLEQLNRKSKTFSLRFAPKSGADVPAATKTVVIDNVPPTVVGETRWSPTGAGKWRIVITASERLSRASLVCDGKPVPAPRLNETTVEADVDSGSVELVLFDQAENRSQTYTYRIGIKYELPEGCVPEPNSPSGFADLPQVVRHKSTGILLTLVPPSPVGGFELGPFERDQNLGRTVSDPFYLGVKEVSLAEFSKGRPSGFNGRPYLMEPGDCDETHPVVNVAWAEANLFCTDRGLLLPTEAQWEWACRYEVEQTFGKLTPFLWGEDFDLRSQWGNLDGTETNAAGQSIGDDLTTPVGSFKATSTLGLYDMIGNVNEWCRDVSSSPGGQRHMIRGASLFARKREWVNFRFRTDASGAYEDVGFRVVAEPTRP
ncbi:MAG: bifunctional serine/threonine-protein kinase/formylglycine-generating enzyme family protein [Planctomycetota bacterium]